ncbi:hypothetical protein JL720_828 [Aureococcus anophagefferens]|nr:hypothetical protein JL720_828 [Aureococcus anophagefferens]
MGPTLKEKRRQKKLAAAQAVAKEDSSSSDSSDSSDDDSSAHIRTVAGNLPFAATEAPLCDLFFPGGEGAEHEETDVEVKRDVESGKSRGRSDAAGRGLAFVDKWADADFEGRKLVVRLERKGVKARPGKPKRRRDDATPGAGRRDAATAKARKRRSNVRRAPREEGARARRRGARRRAWYHQWPMAEPSAENTMSTLAREIKDVLGKGCTICGVTGKLLACPCATTKYRSVACQRVDWKARGHKSVCAKIRARAEAAAQHDDALRDAALADAMPEEELVSYGPAPRSRADEARAHRRGARGRARAAEAQPEKAPLSARYGSRCPICLEDWDVNATTITRACCCRQICESCEAKIGDGPCALCRSPVVANSEYVSHLKRHIENGVPEAMNELGEAYVDRKCAKSFRLVLSAKRAVKLWEKAAQLGNAEAMYNLAFSFEKGRGVKLNLKKAMHFYRMSADMGDAVSQKRLGVLLCNLKNFEERFRYIKLSAEQGWTPGERELGWCYELGDGVEADVQEAKHWFMRAAVKGDEFAKTKLAELGRAEVDVLDDE